jgi:toxin ParE1/3/4
VCVVAVHTEASAEAEEAAVWYEQQREGLGARFATELESTYALLREGMVPGSPWRGAMGNRGVRYLLLDRFPFSVVFKEIGSDAFVLAVAHQARKPGFWNHRLRSIE